jgi:4'-phosphopantetheinyl transferase
MSAPTVDVWWARLSQMDESLEVATARLLVGEERGRAAAYRRPDDRLRFQVGVALTRLILAAEVGCGPEEIRLDRTCPDCGQPHGKVRLAAPRTGWEVSVSHSGDLIGVAVSTVAPLGLDVEQVRAVETSVASLVLTPSEERQVRSAADFIRYWTRKEAVVKATGAGLRQPLNQVTVSAPADPAAVLNWSGSTIRLYDLADRPGHLASLAVLSCDVVTITERDAQPLLHA